MDASVCRIKQLIHGHWWTQALSAAVEMRLFDTLSSSPTSIRELGRATSTNPALLVPFLRALQVADLVSIDADNNVALRPAGELLTAGSPLASLSLLNGTTYARRAQDMVGLLQGRVTADPLWEELLRDGLTGHFSALMQSNTSQVSRDIARLLDLPSAGVVADVGAGSGALALAIAELNPGIRCLAIERPEYVRDLHGRIAETSTFVEVVSGDFFEAVPYADRYVLKSVFHNWGDAECLNILSRLKEANPDAEVDVIERANSESNDNAAVGELAMISLFATPERTPEQIADLLRCAGLERVSSRGTEVGFAIVSGR